MILDTSVIVALLRNEPDAPSFRLAISKALYRRMSSVTFVEAATVIDSRDDPIPALKYDELCKRIELIIEPVTAEQARIAREAYRNFGKGSGHRAQLNLGDVFAYALAKTMREPLLYKGNDFVHTDIRSALD